MTIGRPNVIGTSNQSEIFSNPTLFYMGRTIISWWMHGVDDIVDKRLSFVPLLKYVKKKGLKSLNILNVIGSMEWGADRKVMLRLYISLEIYTRLWMHCVWVSS